MKISIDTFQFSDTSVMIRLEAETIAEVKILYLLAKRVKKVIRSFGFFGTNGFVVTLSIPLRKQKANDDEVSNDTS